VLIKKDELSGLSLLQSSDIADRLLGEILIGCMDCNLWGRPDDTRLVMELLEDDLEALRASVKGKQP